ncbi:hypothetical protein ACQUW5_15095 [Legionella sp. CNM-1927-20]|uniref:hypothetical protein n=1 Tax=Legionella sp. CNM-1927-20 TaxID=3422221 RepID=UPI00403A9EA4
MAKKSDLFRFYTEISTSHSNNTSILIPRAKEVLSKYHFEFSNLILANAIKRLCADKKYDLGLYSLSESEIDGLLNEEHLVNAIFLEFFSKLEQQLGRQIRWFGQDDCLIDFEKEQKYQRFVSNLYQIVDDAKSNDKSIAISIRNTKNIIKEFERDVGQVRDTMSVSLKQTFIDIFKLCRMMLSRNYLDGKILNKSYDNHSFSHIFARKSLHNCFLEQLDSNIQELASFTKAINIECQSQIDAHINYLM